MKKDKFIFLVQKHLARIAASTSAVRGQGAGAKESARQYLGNLNLRAFATGNQEVFQRALDQHTGELERSLPKRASSWGLARKLLNIFLRDALYSVYLNKYYHLERIEGFLEMPLDSITARTLKQQGARGELPRWKGVKHLTPEASTKYQKFASVIAKHEGTERVHLDALWWGGRGEE